MNRTPRCVLAAIIATVLIAPACSVFGSGNDVVLLGDSLTVLVTDQVTKDADGSYGIGSSASWGLRIDELLDKAAKVASDDPDQVIVNLGTNNVLQRHDTVATGEDLATLVLQLSEIRCVHLVTLNEGIRRNGEDYSTEAAALNAQIRTLAARHLNTDVIDWNKIVLDHTGDKIMSSDTVHPNPKGVKLMANAYMQAIDSC